MALYLSNSALTSAINSLSKTTSSLNTTYERLSSGSRINSAKDDAAGLQISNRMTSEINGLTQSSRNASDGIALCQTIEGAMEEITNMLQSIRTLAVQASTGTNTTADRVSINNEAAQLAEEITRISQQTTYGGSTILAGAEGVSGKGNMIGSNGKIVLHVGSNSGTTITINGLSAGFSMESLASLTGTDLSGLGFTVDEDGTYRFSLSTAENAEAAISLCDNFISVVDSVRGQLGAIENRLESTINLNSTTSSNLSDARSRIEDTDYAEEASNLAQQEVMEQMAVTIMVEIMNNQSDMVLSLLAD